MNSASERTWPAYTMHHSVDKIYMYTPKVIFGRGCMYACMCSHTLSSLNAPACTHTSLSHANANALFDAFQEVREKDEDGDPEGARMVRGRLVQGQDRTESKKDK